MNKFRLAFAVLALSYLFSIPTALAQGKFDATKNIIPENLKNAEPIYCSDVLNPNSSRIVGSPFCTSGVSQPDVGCMANQFEKLGAIIRVYESLNPGRGGINVLACDPPPLLSELSRCSDATNHSCRRREYIEFMCNCVIEVNRAYEQARSTCSALN